MSFSFFIAFLYISFNALCLLAYAPQLFRMLKEKNARQYTSLSMWGIWALGGFIEFLYAYDIGNGPWMWMALGHFVACFIVFSLALWGRMEHTTPMMGAQPLLVDVQKYKQPTTIFMGTTEHSSKTKATKGVEVT